MRGGGPPVAEGMGDASITRDRVRVRLVPPSDAFALLKLACAQYALMRTVGVKQLTCMATVMLRIGAVTAAQVRCARRCLNCVRLSASPS